jgi:hypothetical protein
MDISGYQYEAAKNLLEIYEWNLDLAIDGAIQTQDYYSHYKEEKPWVSADAEKQGGSQSSKMDIERQSTSGHDFSEYVKNKHGLKTTKIHFVPVGLTNMLSSHDMEGKLVFLFVNDKQSPHEEHLLKKVLADDELSSTVNSCFTPAAILKDSPELKPLGSNYSQEMGPAILLFKVSKGKPVSVTSIPFGKMSKVQITTKFIEEKLSHFLTHNDTDPAGGNFGNSAENYQFPDVSPHSDNMMYEQELKYKQMMEEVRQKQLKELEEKEFGQLALKKELSIQRRKASEIDMLVARLEPEAKSGDMIRIAVRLPSGTRITRNFSKSSRVEQIAALIYSSKEIKPDQDFRIVWNFPPQEITEDNLHSTMQQVFGDSTQELVSVDTN